MDIIKTKIGDVEVLINSGDQKELHQEYDSKDGALQNTMKTGARQTARKIANHAFEDVSKIVFEIAEGCGKKLKECDNGPNEFNVEFALSFSQNSNMWIFGCENNIVMKVGMQWKSKDAQ